MGKHQSNIRPVAKVVKRNSEELEFLPAALEILESPPSPTVRVLVTGLILLICLTLVWSIVGTLDVVVTGRGKLVPVGNIKKLQTKEMGIVTAIHVTEGQSVRRGDILLELESSEAKAALKISERALLEARLRVSRHQAELLALEGKKLIFRPPSNTPPELVATYRSELQSDTEVLRRRMEGLQLSKAARKSEVRALEIQIELFQTQFSTAAENVRVIKHLLDRGIENKAKWRVAQQQVVTLRKNIEASEHSLERAKAVLKMATIEIAGQYASKKKEILTSIISAQRDASIALNSVNRYSAQMRGTILRAPSDGVVQNLSVHTVGGVAGPQKDLLTIVPTDRSLLVETLIDNKDIGFVHVGQAASLKVDSFPYTVYGMINGTVSTVSRDSILNESGYLFPIQLSMETTKMHVGRKNSVSLVPGMTVSVEIKVKKRRIIEFFLDPMIRHWTEGMRER
ncbi:MAG: HlyD family type I secretion periplasmic adaptor subunit [Hyphomicrobiales bacterium]|nr:HlyD family type I secretion periplasmic adaptor subunit [Hyphomicrobiales bacterium]